MSGSSTGGNILTGANKKGLDAFLIEFGGRAFPFPDIAGTYKGKKVAILGDAACVWDDVERLGLRFDQRRGAVATDQWDLMTINKMVELTPGNIEHAYSNEASLLLKFVAARRCEYQGEFYGPRHTHSSTRGASWHWPWGGFGTSALGACIVAVGLGYDRIVLCGIPLDESPHNGEPPWRRTGFRTEAADSVGAGINRYWQRARDLAFEGKIKSMSGRTRDWLGEPC